MAPSRPENSRLHASPARLLPGSMLAHVTLLLGLGILLIVGLLVGAVLLIGRPADARESLDVIKTVLAVVGGVGGVVALTVLYRKQRQGEVAEERERYKQFSERYVSAAEQMGHDKPSVRVAGVYAMAELADDWITGRQLCIDVLCAYIRLPAEARDGEQEVRRTLFRVIRDHLRPGERWGQVKWSDRKFSFEGATIENADFSGIALVEPGHMSFHRVCFTGSFLMSGLDLGHGARMWFTKATFMGQRASFSGADFRAGTASFDDASFAEGRSSFRGHGSTGVASRWRGLNVPVPPSNGISCRIWAWLIRERVLMSGSLSRPGYPIVTGRGCITRRLRGD